MKPGIAGRDVEALLTAAALYSEEKAVETLLLLVHGMMVDRNQEALPGDWPLN